jgi:hypothetical protein
VTTTGWPLSHSSVAGLRPLPQPKPAWQLLRHSSVSMVSPSSHSSGGLAGPPDASRMPLRQLSSDRQLGEQPSPAIWLPSSHSSGQLVPVAVALLQVAPVVGRSSLV